MYGVIREIVNSDAAPDRGGRFCEQVPKKFRSRCFSGVGSVMSALESGDTLRATCRKVAGRQPPDANLLRGEGCLACPREHWGVF